MNSHEYEYLDENGYMKYSINSLDPETFKELCIAKGWDFLREVE